MVKIPLFQDVLPAQLPKIRLSRPSDFGLLDISIGHGLIEYSMALLCFFILGTRYGLSPCSKSKVSI